MRMRFGKTGLPVEIILFPDSLAAAQKVICRYAKCREVEFTQDLVQVSR